LEKIKTFVFIIVVNSVVFTQTEFIDIQFYDTSSRAFHSKQLKLEIDSLYKYNSNPFILLFVTSSSDNTEYQKQIENLKTINAEALQLIFVDSNAEVVYKYGYHTDKITASNLLGADLDFRILLLNGRGKIIYDYNEALTETRIKELLK